MFVSNFMRYLIESLVICIVSLYIPKINLNIKEILMISLTGAFTLMILDLYAPNVGMFLRHSLGGILGFKNITGTPLRGGGLSDFTDKIKVMAQNLKEEVTDKVKHAEEDTNIEGGANVVDNLISVYKNAEEKLKQKILTGGNYSNKKIIHSNNKNVTNYTNKLKRSI